MTGTIPATTSRTPSRPDRTSRRWLALVVMCFTVLVISLDQSVLNVALPTLVKQLHPSSSGLQWIADGYVLTNAVLLLFGGACGDRFGRRRIFLFGIAIFGIGSLGCALAHSAGFLIAMRSVMGLGAAFLMPATLSVIAATFTGAERAEAIGIWAGVGGIGGAAGPLFGGVLLQHFWWGSIFLINVPIVVVAFLGCVLFVSESRAEDRPGLDPVGVVLSALGLTAFTYALIEAPSSSWSASPVVDSLIAGAVLITGFVIWDRRSDHPLVDLYLFKNRIFSSALFATTALFFSAFSVGFLLSQYLQFVKGSSAFGVGLRLLPMAIGTVFGSNIASRLAARFGLRPILLLGLSMVLSGLLVLVQVKVSTPYLPIGIAFASMGVGLGITVAPASNAIVNTLPSAKVGAGSGLRSMVQLLGASFWVAVTGSLAISHYRSIVEAAFNGPLRAVPASVRPLVSAQIGQAVGAAHQLPAQVSAATVRVASAAYTSGLRLGALVGIGAISVAIAVVAFFVPNRVEKQSDDEDDPELLAEAAALHF